MAIGLQSADETNLKYSGHVSMNHGQGHDDHTHTTSNRQSIPCIA